MYLFPVEPIYDPHRALFSQTSEQAPQCEPVIRPGPYRGMFMRDREHIAVLNNNRIQFINIGRSSG